jgi:hypothetical protein
VDLLTEVAGNACKVGFSEEIRRRLDRSEALRHSSGSIPMWSLSATRSFCLHIFCRVDAYVSEEELDPLQFASRNLAQTRACAPQIVRSKVAKLSF